MREMAAVEAILFVTEAPVPIGEMAEVLELPKKRVEELLEELGRELEDRGSGLVLRQVAGGWRLYSHPDAYPFLERLGLVEEKERLTIPGNPAVYVTTDLFLEKMGLERLADLPPLADHIPPAETVDFLEETLRPGTT